MAKTSSESLLKSFPVAGLGTWTQQKTLAEWPTALPVSQIAGLQGSDTAGHSVGKLCQFVYGLGQVAVPSY